jgi:uncharacterized protein YneF (UPF0154 family)
MDAWSWILMVVVVLILVGMIGAVAYLASSRTHPAQH